MDTHTLETRLAGLPLAAVRYLPVTGSTNDDVSALADEGAGDYSLVVADLQTAGRGRLQRHWVTVPGAALAFSLLLRPTPEETRRVAAFSPLSALAVADALQRLYRLQAEIKWPNDVLLNRQKTCGILVEGGWNGGQLASLVLGIGINVAPASVPPAGELLYPATCVETALGSPVERFDLLRAVLEELIALRPRLGSAEFLQAWEQHLAFRGEWVHVGDGLKPDRLGQVLGVAPDGSLRLRDPSGAEFAIQVGEVHLRPAS
jgi:BirA family biotin operon repressor/biotin-[acetyl-CoA-carboxylase] ligase